MSSKTLAFPIPRRLFTKLTLQQKLLKSSMIVDWLSKKLLQFSALTSLVYQSY